MFAKTILIGNLGSDPKTGSGWALLNVATSESWKDNDGEWQKKTTWYSCFIRGKAVERAAKLKKGMKVFIEGTMGNHKDPEKKYEMHLSVSKFYDLTGAPAEAEKPKSDAAKDDTDDLPF